MDNKVALISLAMVFVFTATAAAAEDPSWDSLRGLRGVAVRVILQDKGGKFKQFVSEDELRTKLELRLRQSGVPVLTEEQMLADPRGPSLDLSVAGLPETDEASAFAIELLMTVNQRLWIVQGGHPFRAVYADSWTSNRLMAYGQKLLGDGRLSADVQDLADGFINAWLATHGK
jgi:hypothetical protein